MWLQAQVRPVIVTCQHEAIKHALIDRDRHTTVDGRGRNAYNLSCTNPKWYVIAPPEAFYSRHCVLQLWSS